MTQDEILNLLFLGPIAICGGLAIGIFILAMTGIFDR